MPKPPVTLLANDLRFASLIQAHLNCAVGHSALIRPAESALEPGQVEGDGLVMLATDRLADSRYFASIMDRLSERESPIVILGEQAWPPGEDLEWPGSVRAIRWPQEAPALVGMVRHHLAHGFSAPHENGIPLEEIIRRRLGAQTPSLTSLGERLGIAATHDMAVLLTGETGSGKTHLARLIHELSPRRAERFLVVPCGCLAPNLMESELFGHVKGAFTGADRAKEGKFAAAGQGTILLDEIDALGWEQQSNLLRVIETGEYEPVGSNATEFCRARIIAASNVDLEQAIRDGQFRQDLYFRIAVMGFHLPPLRERPEDIIPLAAGIVRRLAMQFRKPVLRFPDEVADALRAFPWPGNIRQLENVIQQAVLISNGPDLCLPQPVQAAARQHDAASPRAGATLAHNRDQTERAMIEQALVKCNYRRSRVAELLGVSRVTLYKKMRKYDLMEKPTRTTASGPA